VSRCLRSRAAITPAVRSRSTITPPGRAHADGLAWSRLRYSTDQSPVSGLGAEWSQVQILSPRLRKRPAIAGLLSQTSQSSGVRRGTN
jgi:hypothetical protein